MARSKPLKKSRALTILVGWLDAVKVPYSLESKEDRDLTVGTVPVNLDLHLDITAPLEKAIKVFWGITEAAGYGKPNPIDRGSVRCLRCASVMEAGVCPNLNCLTQQPNRAKFEDAPELVAIRHREFRQVANLPDAVYKDDDYRKIMKWYCRNFFRYNFRLCQDMAYDVEDLETYAMIYLTNFYGRWRKVDGAPGENGKMFCSYLQQRFYSDLLPLLKRKSKNILADEETIDMGLDIHHVRQFEREIGDSGGTLLVPIKNEQEEDIYETIKNMDHDKYIRILTKQSATGETKEIKVKAADLLREHQQGCKFCVNKVPETIRTEPSNERGLADRVLAELPEQLLCPKCNKWLPKNDIGVRTMERDENGNPTKVIRQSYCKPCRGKKSVPAGNGVTVKVGEQLTRVNTFSGNPLLSDTSQIHLT